MRGTKGRRSALQLELAADMATIPRWRNRSTPGRCAEGYGDGHAELGFGDSQREEEQRRATSDVTGKKINTTAMTGGPMRKDNDRCKD